MTDTLILGMNQLIPDLIKNFPKKRSIDFGPRPCGPQADSNSQVIDHTYFWTNIPRYLPPKSIIVAETGTSMFGAINMKAPKDAIFITQFLWLVKTYMYLAPFSFALIAIYVSQGIHRL